jgi:streptogramin lyase
MLPSGRHASAIFGSIIVIVAGCTSTNPTPAASSTAASGAPRATAPTATPAASAVASAPPFEPIEPTFEIAVAGATGAIVATTDGTTVWAVGGTGVLLRIDSATNAVEELAAPVELDDTGLAIADDGLWVTRWAGGHLYRINPRTGVIELSVEMPSAVAMAFIDDGLWVGQETLGTMVLVDRKTGERGPTVTQGAYGAAGLGDLWFGSKTSSIRRVDPATNTVVATIDVPGARSCGVGGLFPDNVWTTCSGSDTRARSVARIDPITNTVTAVATIRSSELGGVGIIDGQPWYIGSFRDSSGAFAGLLRLNGDTGAIERFRSIRGADPDGALVAGGALWIADELGRRVLRVNLTDLSK